MNSLRPLALALAGALCLSACSKHDDASASADTPAASPAAETAAAPAVPQADPSKPLSSYTEMGELEQFLALFGAVGATAPDFDRMAKALSDDYIKEEDEFKKHDLLAKLQPQLEQRIAQAKASPYAWYLVENPHLDGYDFTRKGFPVGEFTRDQHRSLDDYDLFSFQWVNRDQVAFVPVADEALARQIESVRDDAGKTPALKVFFFAQSVDPNVDMHRMYAQVTHVQLIDASGAVLAEYDPTPGNATP